MEVDVGPATNWHAFIVVVDRLSKKTYHSLVGGLKCVYVGNSMRLKGIKVKTKINCIALMQHV